MKRFSLRYKAWKELLDFSQRLALAGLKAQGFSRKRAWEIWCRRWEKRLKEHQAANRRVARRLPIQVDFFFARGAYQRQALRRALEVRLGRRRVRVIAPEDLILHKLLSDRPIDRLDVHSILQEQRKSLDRRYLDRWADRLGLRKALKEALQDSRSG